MAVKVPRQLKVIRRYLRNEAAVLATLRQLLTEPVDTKEQSAVTNGSRGIKNSPKIDEEP